MVREEVKKNINGYIAVPEIVLPELGDGYKYKYSFTDILPDYGEDLSSWADWDGTSDINFGTNVCICIAECTIDNFARKGGIAQNI